MSDDRPANNNGNGAQENGRCLACRAIVPLATTFPRIGGTGHTHVAEKGGLCDGPVVKALLYHVVGNVLLPIPGPDGRPQLVPSMMRMKLTTLQAPEENYAEVMKKWEAAMRATITASDQRGATIIGFQPPPVIVSYWAPIGVEP